MPNWCSNFLRVEGNPAEVKRFADMVIVEREGTNDEYDFTMNKLHPLPDELKDTISPVMWRGDETDVEGKAAYEKHCKELKEKYGYDNWYDWQVANWGTKWDIGEANINEDEEGSISFNYDTAWGPNEAWVKYASTKFPELKFYLTYEEPGCDFCGVLVCEDGEVSEEGGGDLEWTDEDGREVYYDGEIHKYKYCDTDEVIDDEDFWPQTHNPYA